MKFADGGLRPAYNVQFTTDTASQVIVGLDVVTGTDQRQLAPMVDQLGARYGHRPREHLVDGGYVNRDAVSHAAACGTTVYMPLPTPHNKTLDPGRHHVGDTPAVAAWRARMKTETAQRIYRERCATAECVNALARNRGLRAFQVRGRLKARAVSLWYALAHNLMRAVALRAAAVQFSR